jgi:hypothetical protein
MNIINKKSELKIPKKEIYSMISKFLITYTESRCATREGNRYTHKSIVMRHAFKSFVQ